MPMIVMITIIQIKTLKIWNFSWKEKYPTFSAYRDEFAHEIHMKLLVSSILKELHDNSKCQIKLKFIDNIQSI